MDEMLRTNDVIRDQAEEQEAIYLPPYYFAESGCARRLIRLMKADAAKRKFRNGFYPRWRMHQKSPMMRPNGWQLKRRFLLK